MLTDFQQRVIKTSKFAGKTKKMMVIKKAQRIKNVILQSTLEIHLTQNIDYQKKKKAKSKLKWHFFPAFTPCLEAINYKVYSWQGEQFGTSSLSSTNLSIHTWCYIICKRLVGNMCFRGNPLCENRWPPIALRRTVVFRSKSWYFLIRDTTWQNS